MLDYAGQKLGNYKLTQVIGQGGFADVYLGEHIYLQTPAAIKVLQIRLSQDALDKFLTEARIIARLSHPNIIPVLEFGIENDTPFLVMGYAPHGSLRLRHSIGSVLAPAIILPYVKQVAQGLQYAHDRKIIHRDIKPENMLVGNNDMIMLSDFGIAISASGPQSAINQRNTIGTAGTATYMAPEQFDGKPTVASDQYALAVVVYEWLSGTAPFNGSAMEVAMQHYQSTPPSLLEKVPMLPLAIEQVLMQALAKDPLARYATVEDFANALERASASIPSLPPTTRPISLPTIQANPAISKRSSGLLGGEFSGPLVVQNTPSQLLRNVLPAQLPFPDQEDATSLSPPARPTPVELPMKPVGKMIESSTVAFYTQLPLTRRQLIVGLSVAGLITAGMAAVGGGLLAHNLSRPAKVQPTEIVKEKPTVPPPTPSPQPTPSPTPNVEATAQANIVQTVINTTTTRPTVTSAGAGTIDLFIRGADNALWHRNYVGGGWKKWETLGEQLAYDPVAVSTSAGRFDVFVRGADNSLLHKLFDGVPRGWENLTGVITSEPGVVSWAPGRLDVFARGGDNGLWTRSFDGTWHDWLPLGGSFASNPAVTAWAPGRLDVFVRGNDNTLQHIWFDGSWHSWESLGGTLAGNPSATSLGPGQMDIFMRGPNDVLYRKNFNGLWHDWEILDGALTGSPVAVSQSGGQIDVFARGIGNHLAHRTFNGTWGVWETVS